MILALETSGRSGSAAIYFPSEDVVTAFTPLTEGSAKTLAPVVSDLLSKSKVKPSELTAIAVTVGPGSFTGLRVGVAMAKALAYGLRIPVVGVDTLEVLATDFLRYLQHSGKGTGNFGDSFEFWTALDAYRSEFFMAKWSVSAEASISCLLASHLIGGQAWRDLVASVPSRTIVIGSGCQKLSLGKALEVDPVVWFSNVTPTAISVGQLGHEKLQRGQSSSPMELMPIYLRGSAAEEKKSAMARVTS